MRYRRDTSGTVNVQRGKKKILNKSRNSQYSLFLRVKLLQNSNQRSNEKGQTVCPLPELTDILLGSFGSHLNVVRSAQTTNPKSRPPVSNKRSNS